MSKKKKRLVHGLFVLLLLGLGCAGMIALTMSRTRIEKRVPPVPLPGVEVVRVKTGPRAVVVHGEGTVRASRSIELVPQVSGKVIHVSNSLVNGGEFKKGETLLRIDPSDYRLALTLAKAGVRDAESNLKLIREEARAAVEDWRLFHKENSREKPDPPPELVAKEPQVEAAQAALEARLADLEKARLDLSRTELRAPFDGRVISEDIDEGQFVAAGTPVAGIYSIESAEIVVPFEHRDLFWFHVPGFSPGRGEGPAAEVSAHIAGVRKVWKGKVVRTEGRIDERTRMVHVVIRVERPYATRPPLALGLFADIAIRGRLLQNAALIPRSALRDKDTVWVLDHNDRLRFRQVDVAKAEGEYALVRSGLHESEKVVISYLKAVTDGMEVRVERLKEGGGQ